VSVGASWIVLLPGLLIAGIGIGLVNPAIAHVALGVVPPQRSGMASGISNTFRIGGLATGIAALGAVFQHQVQARIDALLPASGHGLVGAIVAGGPRAAAANLTGAGRATVVHAATVSFVSGTHALLIVGTATVAVGAACAFAFVRGRDLAHATAAAQAPVAVEP
jgi:hypothetical protein